MLPNLDHLNSIPKRQNQRHYFQQPMHPSNPKTNNHADREFQLEKL